MPRHVLPSSLLRSMSKLRLFPSATTDHCSHTVLFPPLVAEKCTSWSAGWEVPNRILMRGAVQNRRQAAPRAGALLRGGRPCRPRRKGCKRKSPCRSRNGCTSHKAAGRVVGLSRKDAGARLAAGSPAPLRSIGDTPCSTSYTGRSFCCGKKKRQAALL